MSHSTPVQVHIDPLTGKLSPSNGTYTKRLSELEGLYFDAEAWLKQVREQNDPVVYQVEEFRQAGSDLFFGTTTMHPGKVGDEYFMTRGHFHQDRSKAEVYTTLSGSGLLLLEDRDGRSETVEMVAGASAFIPPDWAHRSINFGSAPLIFTWYCSVAAGHDYGQILERGMRKRVVERDGVAKLIDSASYAY